MKTLLQASALTAALFTAASPLTAQTHVFSVPEGYVNVLIKASPNGTAYAITQFAAPLATPPASSVKSTGRLTGAAATSLSDSAAGWTPGALAAAGQPHFVKIVTGTAAGHLFQITANTASTLAVDSRDIDLSALGIATGSAGDRYEIVRGHTLLSLAGTPADGVIGGTAAQAVQARVDKVLVADAAGAPRLHYYDTDAAHWRLVDAAGNANDLVIPPWGGVAYYRIGQIPLEFTFLGRVPDTSARINVPRDGSALIAGYFPTPFTLSSLGLETLPGWRKLGDPGVTLETTDRVLAQDASGVVRSYYFNGSSWLRPGSAASQNAIPLPVGAAIHTQRHGTPSDEIWSRPLPYDLD